MMTATPPPFHLLQRQNSEIGPPMEMIEYSDVAAQPRWMPPEAELAAAGLETAPAPAVVAIAGPEPELPRPSELG